MFGKLKKILLTYGLETAEYDAVKPRIRRDNAKILAVFSAVTAVVLSATLAVSLFAEALDNYRTIYLAGAVFSALIFTVARIFGNAEKIVLFGSYTFLSLLLMVGLLISAHSTEDLAVIFVALLLVAPLLFNDRPVRMILFLLIFIGLFVCVTLKLKTGTVMLIDILDTVIIGAVSIVVSTYMNGIKTRAHFDEYRIEQLSEHDPLTEIGNRAAYIKCLQTYTANGLPDDLAVVMLDVNGLKTANDTLGHAAGDELICGAASCIVRTFGEYGACFRIGGDEFCALVRLPKMRLELVCNELDKLTGEWDRLSGCRLSISYGYACVCDAPDTSLDELIRSADQMLYRNKAAFYRKIRA